MVTIIVTLGSLVAVTVLVSIYSLFLLEKVKRVHEREMESMGMRQGEGQGEGMEGMPEWFNRAELRIRSNATY
jgi:hypothetical protein